MCDRVLYPSYAATPLIFHVSKLEDQVLAGTLVWVFGTFVYMIAAVILTVRLISGESAGDWNETAIRTREPARLEISERSGRPAMINLGLAK